MIIYEKHIMFNIAYGEMYEYLAWQRQASLNSFDNGFHEIIVLLQAFTLTSKIWEIDRKYYWQWTVLKTLKILWMSSLLDNFMKILEVKYVFWILVSFWYDFATIRWYWWLPRLCGSFCVTCDCLAFVMTSLWHVITLSLWWRLCGYNHLNGTCISSIPINYAIY